MHLNLNLRVNPLKFVKVKVCEEITQHKRSRMHFTSSFQTEKYQTDFRIHVLVGKLGDPLWGQMMSNER